MVIIAFSMPMRRPATSITGAMQFVVQLAVEMILASPASLNTVHDEGNLFVPLGGCGEDHALRPRVEVLLKIGLRGEHPRAFQHEIDLHVGPWQGGGVLLSQHAVAPVADREGRRPRDRPSLP